MFPDNVAVYVLHVNDPKYSDRKLHIERILMLHEIPFEWMLDGNIKDITPKVLTQLFSPNFS